MSIGCWEGHTVEPVDSAWWRIESWLSVHAPATLSSLRPPVASDELPAAQQRIGLSFPPDLAGSLACHDGVEADWAERWYTLFRFPPAYRPMPLHEIVDTWQEWVDVIADVEAQGADHSQWRNREWIPTATTDSDTYLFVVAAPGRCSDGWERRFMT
jgi:cell wall assembly regulator SMI1